MYDDQHGCELVNVSPGTGSPGAVHILYNALRVGEGVEILLYCVMIGERILESFC